MSKDKDTQEIDGDTNIPGILSPLLDFLVKEAIQADEAISIDKAYREDDEDWEKTVGEAAIVPYEIDAEFYDRHYSNNLVAAVASQAVGAVRLWRESRRVPVANGATCLIAAPCPNCGHGLTVRLGMVHVRAACGKCGWAGFLQFTDPTDPAMVAKITEEES